MSDRENGGSNKKGLRVSFQREVKRRSSAGLSFRPHAATMTVNDPLNSRKSDTGPCKFCFSVEALEGG